MPKIAFLGPIGELGRITARDIMREDPIVATESMTIAALIRLLSDHHISGVPVVDEAGLVTGVVSQSDIIRMTASISSEINSENVHPYFTSPHYKNFDLPSAAASFSESSVSSIMTRAIITAREHFTLPEICRVLVHEKVHRILILDARGRLTGLVGSMDIVRLVYQSFLKESLKKKSGRE